jgi:hypothetical protein
MKFYIMANPTKPLASLPALGRALSAEPFPPAAVLKTGALRAEPA